MEYDIILDPTGEAPKAKRSKVANPETWVKNMRKTLRNSGQEYLSSRGKRVPSRDVRPKDCSNCKKNCNESFPEAERLKIFQTYWGLESIEKKKLFISNLVDEVPVGSVRTKAEKSRRSVTRQYSLRFGKVKIPVCKGFFLATLDISDTVVSNILKHRDEATHFPRESLQGKGPKKGRQIPEETKDRIRAHIRSCLVSPVDATGGLELPKKKKRGAPVEEVQYVEQGLNAKRMWEMYVIECEDDGVVPAKTWIYREILHNEFNIKFLDPTARRPPKEVEPVAYQIVVEAPPDEQIYYEECEGWDS